jgi:diamine N-acetyltransferase
MNAARNVRRIHFRRITARTVLEVCRLSTTLTPTQRRMVADNSVSIAQAHFSENAWLRAIHLGKTPIGFIMMHFGSDYDDGIDCPGAYLWRLMIARPHQRKGYGRQALDFLVQHLRAQGRRELYTSFHTGRGSPEGFYRAYGFEPTGGRYGDEPELVFKFG